MLLFWNQRTGFIIPRAPLPLAMTPPSFINQASAFPSRNPSYTLLKIADRHLGTFSIPHRQHRKTADAGSIGKPPTVDDAPSTSDGAVVRHDQ
ncbi:MAG: hypothetical protein H6914_00310 [Novosphingobium sp.]|nr:hypothetical protein [Novosphingobium sp.]